MPTTKILFSLLFFSPLYGTEYNEKIDDAKITLNFYKKNIEYSCVDTFPNEILVLIFSYLAPQVMDLKEKEDGDIENADFFEWMVQKEIAAYGYALRKMALVCKDWQIIVQEKLTLLKTIYKNSEANMIFAQSYDRKDLQHLKEISLANANLREIPNLVFRCNNIEELEILGRLASSKVVSFIPQEIGTLKNLKNVTFSSNNIQEIPEEFWSLTNLEKLNFNNNKIKIISDKIRNLSKLESLSLTGNQIEEFPIGILALTKLSVLHIAKNKITVIPAEIVVLQELCVFFCQDNPLTTLPIEALKKMSKLSNFCAPENFMLGTLYSSNLKLCKNFLNQKRPFSY